MAFMTGLRGSVTHKDRRPMTLTDQHGRKWFTNLDLRSGEPVGMIEPMGWGAPWIPDQKYLFRSDPENPLRLNIDYDAIIADAQRAEAEWWDRLDTVGVALHGQAFDRDKPTPAVLKEVGPKPKPWQVWVACQQGNAFALGLTAEVDVRLAEYLPLSQRGHGLDFRNPDFTEAPAEKVKRPKPAA